MDQALFFAFILVFIRCSAMFLSSPVFGSQTTPVHIRVLITMAISGALTVAVKPHIVAHVPDTMYDMLASVLHEAVAGLLIGFTMSLALRAAEIAGALMDIQIGLGTSQVLNPITGVPVTVLSQFKSMLAMVVFLSVDGHHILLGSLVKSYDALPLSYNSLPAIQAGLFNLLEQTCLLGIQIAAPVIAVSLVVDAAMGLVSRAVPQMPVFLIGAPAKIAVGMITVAVALPALTGGVHSALGLAADQIQRVFLRS